MRKPHFRIPSKQILMEDMTLHRGNRGGKWTGAYKREQKDRNKERVDRETRNRQESIQRNRKDHQQYREIQTTYSLHTRKYQLPLLKS